MKRFVFISLSLFIVCGSSSDVFGSEKCRDILRKTARISRVAIAASTLVAGACSISGCASPNMKDVQNATIFSQVGPRVANDLEQKFKDRTYKWVLQINFNPHDFNEKRNTETRLAKSDHIQRLFHQFQEAQLPMKVFSNNKADIELPKDASFDGYVTKANGPSAWLGTLSFYYDQSNHAVNLISTLFEKPEEFLDNTFIIVTGGSHGADEAASFVSALRSRFHKEPEFIVFSDAVSQPGPIPMFFYFGRPKDAVAVNLYQSHDFWLKGSAIPGFYNVKLSDESHGYVAERAKAFGQYIGMRIDPQRPTGIKVIIPEYGRGKEELYEYLTWLQGQKDSWWNHDEFNVWASKTDLATIIKRIGPLGTGFEETKPFIDRAVSSDSIEVRWIGWNNLAAYSSKVRAPYFEDLMKSGLPTKDFEGLLLLSKAEEFSPQEVDHVIAMLELVSKDAWPLQRNLVQFGIESEAPAWLSGMLTRGGYYSLEKVGEVLNRDPNAFAGFEYAIYRAALDIIQKLPKNSGARRDESFSFFKHMRTQQRFSKLWGNEALGDVIDAAERIVEERTSREGFLK